MTVGLLICDHILDELRHIQGAYDDMYRAVLSGFPCRPYFVCDGQFPRHPEECDAWLVGGSKFSVYDDYEWIGQLQSFVRLIYELQQPFVGICFGHQMLAQSLGGKVDKADRGWCLGVSKLRVSKKQLWMDPFESNVGVLMLCQDQVSSLPEGSEVLAGTIECPVGMYMVGENMLGIQGHPEFEKEYNSAIISSRRNLYGEKMTNTALRSLENEIHHEILSNWIRRFLNQFTNTK